MQMRKQMQMQIIYYSKKYLTILFPRNDAKTSLREARDEE